MDDIKTLWSDPFYRNRHLLLTRILPQMVVNRLGLNRQWGALRCKLGIYPKPYHRLPNSVHPCGWCGKHHGMHLT